MVVPPVDLEVDYLPPDLRVGDVASVLHVAASSGSKDAFEAVLVTLKKYLTPDEVRCLIRRLCKGGVFVCPLVDGNMPDHYSLIRTS